MHNKRRLLHFFFFFFSPTLYVTETETSSSCDSTKSDVPIKKFRVNMTLILNVQKTQIRTSKKRRLQYFLPCDKRWSQLASSRSKCCPNRRIWLRTDAARTPRRDDSPRNPSAELGERCYSAGGRRPSERVADNRFAHFIWSIPRTCTRMPAYVNVRSTFAWKIPNVERARKTCVTLLAMTAKGLPV